MQAKKYKIVTITHVDTSTGTSIFTFAILVSTFLTFSTPAVLSNPKAVAEVVRRVSPDTLVILDAVCAVASEEIRMDDWSIDVVVSASQKGLGAPPGLSVVVASQKALQVSDANRSHMTLISQNDPSVGSCSAIDTYLFVLCELEEVNAFFLIHLIVTNVHQMASHHDSVRERISRLLRHPPSQPHLCVQPIPDTDH